MMHLNAVQHSLDIELGLIENAACNDRFGRRGIHELVKSISRVLSRFMHETSSYEKVASCIQQILF
jgi:hypothetical protein